MLERYYRELLNFLTRQVGDRDTAADLTQESFVRVLGAQSSGQAVLDMRALLYRTARNLVIDQHRRSSIRAELETSPASADEASGLEQLAGPRSLLLDEPYASLDLPSQAQLAHDIAQTTQQVIVSTHLLDHVRHFPRVIWMEGGHVRADGHGAQVCAAYEAHVRQRIAALRPQPSAHHG